MAKFLRGRALSFLGTEHLCATKAANLKAQARLPGFQRQAKNSGWLVRIPWSVWSEHRKPRSSSCLDA